jgi:hypothetical protein
MGTFIGLLVIFWVVAGVVKYFKDQYKEATRIGLLMKKQNPDPLENVEGQLSRLERLDDGHPL